VNADGEVVGRREKGELCIRGYCVMLGYWDDPEQTNKVIEPDRWYSTGYVQVFRLHQMHKMQTTATDNRGVCPSVCRAAQLGFGV